MIDDVVIGVNALKGIDRIENMAEIKGSCGKIYFTTFISVSVIFALFVLPSILQWESNQSRVLSILV